MSSRSALRSNWLVFRPASGRAVRLLVVAVFAFCVASMVSQTQSAEAANYRMVLCAANNGSNGFATATNTVSAQNPGGIFHLQNSCGPAPYPAGCCNYLQINENQPSGNAGVTAYGSISWTAPGFIAFLGGGGYTRMPEQFNDGWRGRFWLEGFDGSTNNALMQGTGVANGSCGGVCWNSCSAFCSHLWPFGGYGFYRRFVFEMTCFRDAGCDRAGTNTVQANTLVWIMADVSPVSLGLTNTGAPFLGGQWVRGNQTVTYSWSDLGTGIRMEYIDLDPGSPGGTRPFVIDHACNRDSWGGVGEFARDFQPCATASNIGRAYTFNTASLADGAHTVRACGQDYAQWQGLDGTGSASCDSRTIRVDNNAPAAPISLQAITPDTTRYWDHFDVKYSLPANSGSPISKVHYRVINAAGAVVMPEQVLTATNPTELKNVAAPKAPGDYRVQVWLEDQVGFAGPASAVPLPRDTTPPAAPQDVSVAVPTSSRAAEGFDVRWRNIVDNGSPIDAAYYQVLTPAGAVVVPTQPVSGANVEQILNLATPGDRGGFELRLWLSDAEGNVGAPASVPLAYRCVRSDVGGGSQLNAQVDGTESRVVSQGEGAVLSGALRGPSGAVANAPLCIFSNVVTDVERDFLGLAITAKDGGYRFGIAPGPSRNMLAIYRPDHREIKADAKIETVVHPTFYAKKRVVRNKQFGRFYGEIPGPHNDRVVVVLQARRGKGWIAFRRYRTRGGGKFNLIYRFHNTTRPTKYVMRAQVRQTTGYPYLQGNSDRLVLKVMPARRVAVPRPGR